MYIVGRRDRYRKIDRGIYLFLCYVSMLKFNNVTNNNISIYVMRVH